MMANSCGPILAAALFGLWIPAARAEEAVAQSGRKHPGNMLLDQGAWVFRNEQNKIIALNTLSYIQFDARSFLLPRVPLTRTLLLPNQQRLSGLLLAVTDAKVSFLTSWGQTVVLRREQIVGIEQANDSLPILHDGFEDDLKSWRIEGQAILDADRRFFGKSSLRLDHTTKSLVREWQPARDNGSIRLFFQSEPGPSNLRVTFALASSKDKATKPGVIIDRAGYRGSNLKQTFGAVKPSQGWHLLSMEIDAGRLRIYVDDACRGQTALPPGATIQGLRCDVDADQRAADKGGQFWIDELIVSQRLPSAARPASDPKQDSLWLVQGEQLFGRIESADDMAVRLDAKFGRRSLPWSQLRGFVFARPKETPPANEPEITFRPCPGFPVDCLLAKLIRWEEGKLIVQHQLLGEIAIERERLDKIRFETKS